MDAGNAPIRGDLDQVGSSEAVRHDVIHILVEVEQIFVISKVSTGLPIEGEVEK